MSPSSKSSEQARVQRDGDVLVAAGLVAGLVDGVEDELDRFLVVEVGGEAAFVADVRVVAGLLQHRLEGVEDLGDHADALGERLGADGHDHEFLEVDLVVGVLAAVDDVGHRDGQDAGVGAADVAVERQAVGRGGRLGGGQADAQDRVGAELALVRRAVGRDQRAVEPDLVGRVAAHGDLGQRRVDVGDGLGHALAEVARLVAVAQLDRLVDPRAGPGGDRGPAQRAVGQDHIHLDGRVAAAVEDLAPANLRDRSKLLTHGVVKLRTSKARRACPRRETSAGSSLVRIGPSITRFIRRDAEVVKAAVARRSSARWHGAMQST